MIKSFLKPGGKIEISSSASKKENIAYVSQIEEIYDESKMKISAPILSGKIVPLHVDTTYFLIFYTPNGLYSTKGKVYNRKKVEDLYFVEIEIIQELKKIQRREFFRFDCILPFEFELAEEPGVLFDGIIKDISGGGIRFISNDLIDKNTKLQCIIPLDENQSIQAIGTILSRTTNDVETYKYEYRLQFTRLSDMEQEKIIKFIFEEQRKRRSKEKGL